jgi:surface polysaccharide O-acyltransferase-like enzyme
MSFPHVNYLAILVSGVAIFMLGGLWYSLLFKKPWVALMGIPEEKMKEGAGGAMPFFLLLAFLCALVISYIMAIVINHFSPFSPMRGVMVGTMMWVGFAAPTSFATAVFSMTKKPLWMINTTYNLVSFIIAGVILSVWR